MACQYRAQKHGQPTAGRHAGSDSGVYLMTLQNQPGLYTLLAQIKAWGGLAVALFPGFTLVLRPIAT